MELMVLMGLLLFEAVGSFLDAFASVHDGLSKKRTLMGAWEGETFRCIIRSLSPTHTTCGQKIAWSPFAGFFLSPLISGLSVIAA